MQNVPLYESAFTTLDSNGNGSVRLGPDGAAGLWHPEIASVSVSTNNLEADCSIYAGAAPIPQWFVEGTHSGSTGDSTDRVTGKVIARTKLPYIWAAWTGGDPGAQATLNISGTKDIR